MSDLFAPRREYPYIVEYGWPGMPTRTERVDLQRRVVVGDQIMVGGQWWRITQMAAPSRGASHLGHVTAVPAD